MTSTDMVLRMEMGLGNDDQSSKIQAPLENDAQQGKWASHARNKARWIAVAIALAALVLVIRALPIEQKISAWKAWVEGLGNWGPYALGGLYVVSTILCIPGTILSLAAGGLFGLWTGLVVASLASTAGAACTFWIARYLGRKWIAKVAANHHYFDAIDRAIGEGGWKVVGLLRLSPAIPFNLQNYLYGVTSVRFWPCISISWIAMLPGTFMYVYIGHVTGAAVAHDRQRSTGEWIMLGIGLLSTIVVSIYITRLAKRKLTEKTL